MFDVWDSIDFKFRVLKASADESLRIGRFTVLL